jgi:hypothetical protein
MMERESIFQLPPGQISTGLRNFAWGQEVKQNVDIQFHRVICVSRVYYNNAKYGTLDDGSKHAKESHALRAIELFLQGQSTSPSGRGSVYFR